MFKFILNKVIGSQNDRELVRYRKLVEVINSLEPAVTKLSDNELRQKTVEFKGKLLSRQNDFKQELEELEQTSLQATSEERRKINQKIKVIRNKIFDEFLPEAFAVVREAARRNVNMRHFDSQLIGGMVLYEGRIAEMATGEGKTLVATLPAYLNALLGRGVHVVTVNDYLARRDREWMGPIYESLGLSVGSIQHDMSDDSRRIAYSCDITYGTNNEFGFDYLRDNMKMRKEDLVQRPFYYAIVDEVDSILIDEARTPLIISGPAEESTDKYYTIDRLIPKLKGRMILERDEIDAKHKGIDLDTGYDFMVDEKSHSAHLTDEGEGKACQLLNIESLHDIETMDWRHHIIQGLRAHKLYKRDVDYVVKDGEVIIVDEFTGRLMPGRRWSDGLHQAIEAKEGLRIERENQTLATITLQNYFRMYERLAGMTGTAFTEASEFKHIYDLDVIVIPTNRELKRTNYPDVVYKAEDEKFNAVVEEIVELNNAGRPVLVGTITIEKSERLAGMLKRRGIQHNVLNAKYHEMEASIVAQAGRYKAVTIATNMAGRGTDILLGGNAEFLAKSYLKQNGKSPQDEDYLEVFKQTLEKFKKDTQEEHLKVVEAGGLHIIGTERHEARRIDNQLRGRAGRQGDPGSSRFYVSFGDDLMRLFAPDWILRMLNNYDSQGQPLTLSKEGRLASIFSKSIETAQKRVENHNFEIRKQILEYDNVMNKQREIIYQQRRTVLFGQDLKEEIQDMIAGLLNLEISNYIPQNSYPEQWDIEGILTTLKMRFGVTLELVASNFKNQNELIEFIQSNLISNYEKREEAIGSGVLRYIERMVILQITDTKWKEHLYSMDLLREGIHLRGYAQRDPLVEYKHEAFLMFQDMIDSIKQEVVELLFRVQPQKEAKFKAVFQDIPQELVHQEFSSLKGQRPQPSQEELPQDTPDSKPAPVVNKDKDVGRNDPCPCGSTKKYKKCCGR